MATIQMRNVPNDLYEALVKLARAERRSISQQAIVLLEQALEDLASNKERRQVLLNKIQERALPETSSQPVNLLAEDRSR